MEWNDITIRKVRDDWYEAELEGGYLKDGDNGCSVTFKSFGDTEADARANLNIAISQVRTEAIPVSGTGGE